MKSETPSNPDRERRLDEVVTAYLKATEAGENPQPAQWLLRYPDLADELKSFFAAQEQIVGMAGPLPINATAETVGLEGASGESSLGTVRYVGDYELLEEIARGGMGVVYKARQVSLNRVVALKMILAGQLASKGDVQRFKAEAEAAGKLDHPNIVPIYEVGEHDGQQYFSMKLIEGGSLASEIARFGDRPRDAARLLSVVARAVHHAHQRGILHRDLKPSNILLDPQGQPHVTDFGLAKRVEADSSQTQSGAIVGTPSYMSPEQAQAVKTLTTATDIYGLGGILYILLTGQPPFQAPSPLETLLKVVEQEPVRPRSISPRVNRDLETICLKCLEKDPAKRYGSAEALADELDRWLRDEPIVARPTGTVERSMKWARRHPAGAALLLVTVLGVAGIVWKYVDAEMQRAKAQRAEHLAKTNEERATKNEALAKKNETLAKKNEMAALENARQARAAEADAARQKRVADDNAARAEGMLYASNIVAAKIAWEADNPRLGYHYLDSCRWDMRGWEHDYLHTAFNANQFTFRGHTSLVSSVAFSPDGKRIASGSWDKTVKVWDAISGQEVLTLKGHTSSIRFVVFSSDGAQVFSSCLDGTAKLWDATNGKEIRTFKLPESGHAMALSPDGKRLFCMASKHSRIVWDRESGQSVFKLPGKTAVNSAAFSPDGKRIVSGGEGGVIVWDATTGQETLRIKGSAKGLNQVRAVAFSPDGKRIVSSNFDNTAKVWNAETGHEIFSLKGRPEGVRCVAYSRDGKRVVSCSDDATIKVWDAVSGQEILNLKGHASYIFSVDISPDGKRIVSGSHDGTVKLWDATKRQETLTLTGASSGIAFSPDGKQLVGGGNDTTVKVWDVASGQETLILKGHSQWVGSVAFSPDGKRIVSGSADKTVKIWDAMNGQNILTLKGHTYVVRNVTFSSDGVRIISGGESVKVWDAVSGQGIPFPLIGQAPGGSSMAIGVSRDDKRIVSGSILIGRNFDASVRVWDAATGQEIFVLKGHTQSLSSVAFSADGKRIVSGSLDKTARVWDAVSGKEIFILQGHTDSVDSVAFSPDGKRIVSGSRDKTVRVWNAETGQETISLKGHTYGVNKVAFSYDGKRIASSSADIKVWDAQKTQESFPLQGHTNDVTDVAFSQDGKRILSTDGKGDVRSWDIVTGRPIVPCTDAAPTGGSTATSADGALRLIADGATVRVVKTAAKNQEADREFLKRLNDPEAQLRWHRQEADASEKASQWFAAAFHLKRLLDAEVPDAEVLQARLKRCEEKLVQP